HSLGYSSRIAIPPHAPVGLDSCSTDRRGSCHEDYCSPRQSSCLLQWLTMAGMEQALAFKDSEGHRITGILASPPSHTDRVAILCHGFLSNKNTATSRILSSLLLERGIATFRFDFLGQGESEGPFEQITVSLAVKEALAALDLVASKGYKRASSAPV